jgi:hypothetical protein
VATGRTARCVGRRERDEDHNAGEITDVLDEIEALAAKLRRKVPGLSKA